MEKRQLWHSTTDIESGRNIKLWAYLIWLDCLRQGFRLFNQLMDPSSVHKSGENLPLYKTKQLFSSLDICKQGYTLSTVECRRLSVHIQFHCWQPFTWWTPQKLSEWQEAKCKLWREGELANVNCMIERGVVFVASPPPLRNPFVFQQLQSPPVALLFPAHRAVEEKYEKGTWKVYRLRRSVYFVGHL